MSETENKLDDLEKELHDAHKIDSIDHLTYIQAQILIEIARRLKND